MLLLAAAINWIVAWACVLWMPRQPWRMSIDTSLDDPPALAAEWGRLRWADDPSIWVVDRDWRREVRITRESGPGVLISRMSLDKQWPVRRGSGLTKVARVMVVECGWPCLGLAARHVVLNPNPEQVYPEENARWPASVPDSASNWHGAVQAPEFLGGQPIPGWFSGAPWFPLPYAVRPLAFAASTLFWLAVLVTPGIAFRTGRRAIRRRRGRCGGCGYDVRGLEKCPECAESCHACNGIMLTP
jgi:hypothetical protein